MDTARPTLVLRDQTWEYLKDRVLERGQVFRAPDGSSFLRTGERPSILAEVTFARDLHDRGFPVPEVVEDGVIDGYGYYIERSLGAQTLGERFTHEYRTQGRVSEEGFGKYCDVTVRFLQAQIQEQNQSHVPSELRIGINLENVLEENPELNIPEVQQAVGKAEARLRVLPLVLSHGDFGPFNVLENGIIDFEHKFIAPLGFDVLTSPFVGRFWNFTDGNGRLRLAYDFTDEQIQHYMQLIDNVAAQHGVAKLSSFTDDFIVLKAVWSLSFERAIAKQSGDETKWHWRKAVLQYCVRQYLAGEAIDTRAFTDLSVSS